jgi:hypothetical protein
MLRKWREIYFQFRYEEWSLDCDSRIAYYSCVVGRYAVSVIQVRDLQNECDSEMSMVGRGQRFEVSTCIPSVSTVSRPPETRIVHL